MPAKKSKPAAAPVDPAAWVKWVALSTTLFAVCAAIASIKSGGYSGKIAIWTTKEANTWAQYQAKSIKESLKASELDSLELAALDPGNTAKARKFIADKAAFCKSEIERYNSEKKAIQADAEKLQAEQAEFKKHSGSLGQAVMFLQIAIMLSSIASLMKQKPLWFAGMAIGGVGLLYMAVGLLA